MTASERCSRACGVVWRSRAAVFLIVAGGCVQVLGIEPGTEHEHVAAPDGSACASDSACASGMCADGVCCSVDCDEPCGGGCGEGLACHPDAGVCQPAVIQVAARGDHTCALLAGGSPSQGGTSLGTVQCWGANEKNQLGNAMLVDSVTPVVISGLDEVLQISAGDRHACALRTNGEIWCWGSNVSMQLGRGFSSATENAAPVIALPPAIAVAAGFRHSCALAADGTVRCWGWNGLGQLGAGDDQEYVSAPTLVALKGAATDVTCGDAHCCAVLSGGGVQCWGLKGQLGNGSGVGSNVPVDVVGALGASTVEAGRWHTCGTFDDGARCWGNNSSGQLGNGNSFDGEEEAPVSVLGWQSGQTVALGYWHSCAYGDDGSAACWGRNEEGQLGIGDNVDREAPVSLEGLGSVIGMAAGEHTCAVTDDGLVRCWGRNNKGQLGIGVATTPRFTPSAAVRFTSAPPNGG